MEAIQERGKIIVALVHDTPPYAFQNDTGEPEGMDYAMANTLAEDLGVELELFTGTAQDVINAVRSGDADVGLGAFLAGDKALNKVQETAIYSGGAQCLLECIEDYKTFTTFASYDTKTIACLRDVPAQLTIMKELLPNAQSKMVRDIESGISKLRSGTCAALMLDKFCGIAYGYDNPDLSVSQVALETETAADGTVMLVMQENETLLNFLNTDIIEKYEKSGGLGRLMISATTKAQNLGLLDDQSSAEKGTDTTEVSNTASTESAVA